MRKRHSPDFKAKAVLEALKEKRPLNQIASDLEVHPNMLGAWKASAVKGLFTLFERENKALADKEAADKQREELYAEIGKPTTHVAWLKKNLASTFRRDARLEMLERSASELTLGEQADLLGVSRSSLYHMPRPPSDWEVRVEHRIDAIYTQQPFYGSRRIEFLLKEEGFEIGRDAVRQFMREMAITAIYPKPNARNGLTNRCRIGGPSRFIMRASRLSLRPEESAAQRSSRMTQSYSGVVSTTRLGHFDTRFRSISIFGIGRSSGCASKPVLLEGTQERRPSQETESVEGPAVRSRARRNRHGTIAPETDTSERHSHHRRPLPPRSLAF